MKKIFTLFALSLIYLINNAQTTFDVKFYKIYLNVTNTSTAISGYAQMNAVTKSSNFNQISLDLATGFIIDSVKVNSIKRTSSLTNNKLTISLTTPLNSGVSFTTLIYYHGNGAVGSSFPAGMANGTYGSQKYTYTLSEPYYSYLWWPCKQDLTDKADSAYIFITTESTNKVAANGLLTNTVTGLPGSNTRYEWKTRYTIDYYLIAFSAGPYTEYDTYANPIGASSPILIQDFVYSSSYLNSVQSVLNQTHFLIELFSGLYGMYPFKNEKYGHFSAPCNLGCLENQTMTMMSGFSFSTVAHELTHQWYGDDVTCGTWQDVWLNEGFATYGEYLANQYLVSKATAMSTFASNQSNALVTNGCVYVASASLTNPYSIFNTPTSYDKGAAVLHMLRFEVGDTMFFNILKNYHIKYAKSTATTDSLSSFVSLTTQKDYSYFFNQWIYGSGYPIYNFSSYQTGDTLYITSTQTTSDNSTPLYKMKLDFKVQYNSGTDTLIAYQTTNSQVFKFAIPGKIATTIYCNPSKWNLMQINNAGSNNSITVQQISTSVNSVNFKNINLKVYPNPLSENAKISFDLTENCNVNIDLFNIYGSKIASLDNHFRIAGNNTFSLNTSGYGLSNGFYIIRIATTSKTEYAKIEIIN